MVSDASDRTDPRPADPTTHRARWPRIDLSATQLLATALAAVTATLAASFLGVTGTVIGAAVASVVATTGNAVYSHSLHRTRERVRVAAGDPVFLRERRAPAALPAQKRETGRGRVAEPGRRTDSWRHVATGAVAVFAVVLAVVTGVELMAGRPVSDLVRGDAGSGTTLFGPGRSSTNPPAPTVTRTVTPSVVVVTPTVTRTAPPATTTTTPTPSTTPTPAPPSGSAPASGATPTTSGTQLG